MNLFEAKRNYLLVQEDSIDFYLKDFSKETIEKTFYIYAKKQLEIMIEDRRVEWDNWICLMNGIKEPTITVKYTTSQWGSCIMDKSKISVSTRLIHYPSQCLDYILLHEYTHLLVPNHSKEFYAFVRSYMPDYKEISRLLK